MKTDLSLPALWLAARTRRYHTHVTVTGAQNLADHSFGVALIIMRLHPDPSKALIYAALTHDLGESRSGDVPYTAKKQYDLLRNELEKIETDHAKEHGYHVVLGKEDRSWLKSADMFECWLWATMEVDAGNRHLIPVQLEAQSWIKRNAVPEIKAAMGAGR